MGWVATRGLAIAVYLSTELPSLDWIGWGDRVVGL